MTLKTRVLSVSIVKNSYHENSYHDRKKPITAPTNPTAQDLHLSTFGVGCTDHVCNHLLLSQQKPTQAVEWKCHRSLHQASIPRGFFSGFAGHLCIQDCNWLKEFLFAHSVISGFGGSRRGSMTCISHLGSESSAEWLASKSCQELTHGSQYPAYWALWAREGNICKLLLSIWISEEMPQALNT